MHLREYLDQQCWSQREFGQMLDPPVGQSTVSHWLLGLRRISLAEALQIHRLTGGAVSLDELAQLSSPEAQEQMLRRQHDRARAKLQQQPANRAASLVQRNRAQALSELAAAANPTTEPAAAGV